MAKCYIGIGANLNNPLLTVKKAIAELGEIPQTSLISVSQIYQSKPMGPEDQPDYVNAAALVSTHLTPHELFKYTCDIELLHGRVRNGAHWGPRTLDLDILLYDNLTITDETLTVPHYGMKEREFVIYPLLDIDPSLVLPCGTQVNSLTQAVPLNGMTAIEE